MDLKYIHFLRFTSCPYLHWLKKVQLLTFYEPELTVHLNKFHTVYLFPTQTCTSATKVQAQSRYNLYKLCEVRVSSL